MFAAPGNGEAVDEGAPVVNVPLIDGDGIPVEITVAAVVGAGAVLSGMVTVGTCGCPSEITVTPAAEAAVAKAKVRTMLLMEGILKCCVVVVRDGLGFEEGEVGGEGEVVLIVVIASFERVS